MKGLHRQGCVCVRCEDDRRSGTLLQGGARVPVLEHPAIGKVPTELADLVAEYRATVDGLQAMSEALARMGVALAPLIRRAQRASEGGSSEGGGR